MSREAQSVLFLCDGADQPPTSQLGRWQDVQRLNHRGDEALVNLRIENLSHKLLAELEPRQSDLVRIAAYVYAADQSMSRGGDTDVYGQDWRRRLGLHVPVLDFGFWSDASVARALEQLLHFLTDDQWEFTFTRAKEHDQQSIFDMPIETLQELHDNPDHVALFSAGADSLSATAASIAAGRKPLLLSHRPTFALDSRQKQLASELRTRMAAWELPQLGLIVNRRGSEAKDSSQRSRSFLFASVGSVVAARLAITEVHLADNGVVSLNMPMNDQLIGALSSRSTHPKFMQLFNAFVANVLPEHPVLSNPLWDRTRAEALQLLTEAGCADLVELTISCSRARGRVRAQPQCGYCSQCVDRRFGVLARALENYDEAERYGVDIFIHELAEGEPRTVATSYVRFAQTIEGLDVEGMFVEFPQLYDCLDVRGFTRTEVATRLGDLLRRHAHTVLGVLESQVAAHRNALVRAQLPPHSLLRLVSTDIERAASGESTTTLRPSLDYRTVSFNGKSST